MKLRENFYRYRFNCPTGNITYQELVSYFDKNGFKFLDDRSKCTPAPNIIVLFTSRSDDNSFLYLLKTIEIYYKDMHIDDILNWWFFSSFDKKQNTRTLGDITYQIDYYITGSSKMIYAVNKSYGRIFINIDYVDIYDIKILSTIPDSSNHPIYSFRYNYPNLYQNVDATRIDGQTLYQLNYSIINDEHNIYSVTYHPFTIGANSSHNRHIYTIINNLLLGPILGEIREERMYLILNNKNLFIDKINLPIVSGDCYKVFKPIHIMNYDLIRFTDNDKYSFYLLINKMTFKKVTGKLDNCIKSYDGDAYFII